MPKAEDAPPLSGRAPAVYDFKHPERITKDQLRALRGLHEKFAQTFGTSLSTSLRAMIQVDLERVEQVGYAEYMMSLANPNCLYVLEAEHLHGNALLAVKPELTMFIIDRLLGGIGEGYNTPRPITMIEQNVLRQVVERALKQLNETWHQSYALETKIVNFESNPLFVQIAPATETVILLRFKVQTGEISNTMDLCFPYFMLEDILPELSMQRWYIAAQQSQEQQTGAPRLNRQIKRVDVPVIVTLDTLRLTVHETMQLQVGDILRLDRRINDELDVNIDRQVKYRCRPGTIGSRMAVQITALVDSEEDNHGDRRQ